MFIAGAVVQWLRDGLGADSAVGADRAAGCHRAGQRRRVFRAGVCRLGRAALGSLRPRGRSSASLAARPPAHFARAAVESMAFQTRDLLDAMQRDAGIPLTC